MRYWIPLLAALLWGGSIHNATAQRQLPKLRTATNDNGKYGFCNEKNELVIPHLFDYASSFDPEEPLSCVEFDKHYYLIDREGYLFTETSYKWLSDMPKVYRYYLHNRTPDGKDEYLIDLRNRRISPVGSCTSIIRDYEKELDPALFLVRKQDEQYGFITGLDFRPINTIRVSEIDNYPYEPQVIGITTESGHGTINARGEVLIPAQFSDIRAFNTKEYTLEKRLRKTKHDPYKLDITFFVARKGDLFTIFDAAGHRITPPIKAKYAVNALEKSYKRYLLHYIDNFAQYRHLINERVYEAYTARRMAHDELTKKMTQRPYTTAHSLVRRAKSELAQKEAEAKRRAEERRIAEAKRAAEERAAAQRAAEQRAAAQRDFMARTGSTVVPPAAGSFPHQQTVYVGAANGSGSTISLYCYYNNGTKMIRCSMGGVSGLFRYVDEAPDRMLFQEGNLQPVFGQFNTLQWKDNPYGHAIVVFKDWSMVYYVQGTNNYFEYNRFVTKAEFDKDQQLLQRLNAVMNSGGGGGGGAAPAQVESGMSASYYQSMYQQYERLAESTYNTLTATGASITYSDNSKEGSTLGSWSSSDYSQLKRDLRQAQSNMQRIRSEASRAGHHISPSHWETVTVSY